MKIKIDKFTLIFFAVLIVSSFIRLSNLDSVGYTTDEPVIITAGIKHFLNNPYSVSLYDMATPGGQWPIGLSIVLLSNRDFSPIRNYPQMDYASIDVNRDLIKGLEFAARLPSALAGIISGVVIYFLVKNMYGKKAGLISFALFSFNPLIIDYSRVALLEIFQILYTVLALLFFYLWLEKKKLQDLVISSVFLGLIAAAKLNGLVLIPLFAAFSTIAGIKMLKKELSFDVVVILKNILIIAGVSALTLGIIFGFDFSVPYKVYQYYNLAGGAGIHFVLFELLYDSLFFNNPLLWILVASSLYMIYKEIKNIKLNDAFSVFLLVLLLFSGFFEAHESIKRGIQYSMLFFIIAGRVFSDNNKIKYASKFWLIISLVIIISDLALTAYYFPNMGLAKNVLCTSQECQDGHNLRNFDSRIVGEYLNSLNGVNVYDPVGTTGLIGFYVNNNVNYINAGIAKLMLGTNTCPSFEILKNSSITHVIGSGECVSSINNSLARCPYNSISVKNYEMTKVYDIRSC
ncbi:Dolichyl-phosphate-mannose-protein mannosyltransferase [Candidatus Tiddalikarchaeum anstoanum]|nr:Dolichyl-phosphate-mannose-protein mannosyltransferase [Candidatus Tiddalikarchaeum anstoanum]